MSAINRPFLAALAILASASCSVDPVSIPTPTGPSELALSLALSATPDTITQDGVSQSRLNIIARDAYGQPIAGLPLRVDILVQGLSGGLVGADYGTLSNRWPSTGSDGKVLVTYQAPEAPAPGVESDRVVTLRVIPIGSDYSNALSRTVQVLLVRPGVIQPPTRMVPRFTFSPSNPREYDSVFFDASASSDPDGDIVSYSWRFGDGETATGRQATHSYELAGSYGVVLTVSDAFGTRVSTPVTSIAVSSTPGPVANFTISPTDPKIGTPVTVNAAGSTVPAGRRITGYNWDFGDGTFKTGVAVQHTYQSIGTFTIVLQVTDDTGRTAVKSQTVTVDDLNAPVANFTFSPTDPSVGTNVVFNASSSTVPTGRTIVSYEWNFGDNTGTASGVTVSHSFMTAKTYTVVLTVTDSTGRKGVKSLTVVVLAPPVVSEEPFDRESRR